VSERQGVPVASNLARPDLPLLADEGFEGSAGSQHV